MKKNQQNAVFKKTLEKIWNKTKTRKLTLCHTQSVLLNATKRSWVPIQFQHLVNFYLCSGLHTNFRMWSGEAGQRRRKKCTYIFWTRQKCVIFFSFRFVSKRIHIDVIAFYQICQPKINVESIYFYQCRQMLIGTKLGQHKIIKPRLGLEKKR